jgi:alpha-glucosidase
VDGERIGRFLVRERFDESQCGWYYDLSDRTVLLKFPMPKKDDFELVVSTEKFDLIGMNED